MVHDCSRVQRQRRERTHHRQREGLLLHVLPGVKQNKSQNFNRLPEPHLISQDPAGPLDASQWKFSY